MLKSGENLVLVQHRKAFFHHRKTTNVRAQASRACHRRAQGKGLTGGAASTVAPMPTVPTAASTTAAHSLLFRRSCSPQHSIKVSTASCRELSSQQAASHASYGLRTPQVRARPAAGPSVRHQRAPEHFASGGLRAFSQTWE